MRIIDRPSSRDGAWSTDEPQEVRPVVRLTAAKAGKIGRHHAPGATPIMSAMSSPAM
jgi:hypothetical protein